MGNEILFAENYNDLCSSIDNNVPFYEWLKAGITTFSEGMICSAFSWYTKKDRWFLETANYDPLNEPNSTWYARPLTNLALRDESNVQKYFKLEKDERLTTTYGKDRPVKSYLKQIERQDIVSLVRRTSISLRD